MKRISVSGLAGLLMVLSIFMMTYALLHHIKTTNFRYPLEYREGVVQYWVNCFADGKSLYPEIGTNPPYLHNPYTPLFFIFTGTIQKILPKRHIFFPGRLISFLSLLITCFFILKIIRLYGTSITSGLIAMSFFLCSPISINYGSLELVDVMALFFSIAGLYAAKKNTKTSFIFSGILCAAAFLTKPVFVLAGISISIAALFANEKNKNNFFIALVVSILLVIAIMSLRYKENIFTHLIVFNSLPLTFSHLLNLFSTIGIRHSFLFCFLVAFVGMGKNKKDPLYWYCLLSPVILLFSAKIGSEANYFFEIVALSSICTGILFQKIELQVKKVFLLACIAQMFLFLPFKVAPVFTKTYGQELPLAGRFEPLSRLKEAGEIIEVELISVPDPVLSEDIGWLVLAEKEVVIEPYQFSQLAKYERWDDSFIVKMIKEKQFNLILMNAESYEKGGEKFTISMLDAIKANYQVKRIIGNIYILEQSFRWEG